MSSPLAAFAPLGPEDAAVVQALANELHSLRVASKDECYNIARALLDAGCPSLTCLVELPINSVEELQNELGALKNVKLNNLQLGSILKWMRQQRLPATSILQQTQFSASNLDIGSKRPHPVASPLHTTSRDAPPIPKDTPPVLADGAFSAAIAPGDLHSGKFDHRASALTTASSDDASALEFMSIV
jgi:hypothetical protein